MLRVTNGLVIAACCLFWSSSSWAEVQTKEIEYSHDGTKLTGFLAWDDSVSEARPGILVVHEWWGLNDHAREQAKKLAAEGYVAFAVDMYGDGKTTEHPKEAGAWASEIRKNVDAWRARALSGLEILKKQEQVDPEQIAAIGYCFGGSTVLQLAYANAPVKGVVSFHGGLTPPESTSSIKPKILVCHGAIDPMNPPDKVEAFQKGLEKAGADYVFIAYGGAKHSFTNPDADSHGIDGIAYHEQTDRRSWRHMKQFFDELFAR